MSLLILRNYYAPANFDKEISVHFFEKSGSLSSAGPEILAFGSYCSVKFQPILDGVIPNF